jgi:hypothetical protein
MIKGRRVYLVDLIEEYPATDKHYYAVYHQDTLMSGPFTVIAAGKRRISVQNLYGRRADHYTGDIGLVPYPSGKMNETNATYEIVEVPTWIDDWM